MIAQGLRGLVAVLLVAPGLSFVAPAQGAAESRAASRTGRLEFSETKHDFGRIKDDHPVDWRFPFTNKANVPVAITDVITTCGCTTFGPDVKKTYHPGESGAVVATFNPLNRQAMEKKIITIKTDEPDAKPINLELLVYVIPRIGIDHPAVFFGEVRFDSVAANHVSKSVTITSRVPTFVIKSVTSNDPRFVVKALPPTTGEADGDKVTFYKYDIEVVSDLPIGRHQADLRIDTNDPLKVQINIPLIIEAYGALRVTPQPLALQMATPGTPVDMFVTIASRDSKPFHITEAKITGCENMPLETRIEPVAPNSKIGWRVHVIGTSPAAGSTIKGALVLKTDDATQPVVEVPITGYVMRKAHN